MLTVNSIVRSELVFDAIALIAANPTALSLANVIGAGWPTMFRNPVAALRDETLAPVEVTVTRA